jgi:hypothetical protein
MRHSETYRRLLAVGQELASQSGSAATGPGLIDEFLELASSPVALADSGTKVAPTAHIDLPLGRRRHMPISIERMFETAIQRCGVNDVGSMLLLAASIDAIRDEAVIEEPNLLRDENALRL